MSAGSTIAVIVVQVVVLVVLTVAMYVEWVMPNTRRWWLVGGAMGFMLALVNLWGLASHLAAL